MLYQIPTFVDRGLLCFDNFDFVDPVLTGEYDQGKFGS